MNRLFSLVVLAAMFTPTAAAANCTEQQQEFRVGQDQVTTIKSYLCSVGGGGQLRVEFYDLSGVAAGIALGHSPTTAAMSNVLGPYQLVENPVSETFNSLFSKYARAFGIGGEQDPLLFTTLPSGGAESYSQTDALQGRKVKAILVNPDDVLYYPVTRELGDLSAKSLPPGSKFYYWLACYDGQCQQERMVIWRPMTPGDLANFKQNLATEKRTVTGRGIETSTTMWSGATKGVEEYLRFVQAVAGDNWPEDFLTLELSLFDEGCAGGGHWNHQFSPRDMGLRIALITNVSNVPVTVDGLVGTGAASEALRPAPASWSPGAAGGLIGMGPVTLPAGGSIVVPLQVRFPPPASVGLRDKDEVNNSNAWFKRFGSRGLNTSPADYGIPRPRPYAYGPEINLSGLRANGTNVQFAPRSANFIEMVASYEAGSCPYLMAWDGTDGEWVDHGKVLHEAKGKAREMSETISFAGFKPRVRLEEREPELASIDAVVLEVVVKGGATWTLPPDHAALAARDGRYVELHWDDAVEIAFALPAGLTEDDVVSSRLTVSGFYMTYAEIKAAKAEGDASRRSELPKGATSVANACPAALTLN